MKRQLEIPINPCPWLLILVTLAGLLMLLTRCATVNYYDQPAYFSGGTYEEHDTVIGGDTLYFWRFE